MDILAAIKAAAAVISTIAKYTPNKIDDALAQILDALLTNQALIDFITGLLNQPEVVLLKDEERTQAIQTFAAANANASVQSAVSEAGIPWAKFIEYLPVIARILLSFLGKRG